jgi:hypothetical protein
MWLGGLAFFACLGVVIHSSGAAVVTDPSPCATAFLVLAGVALAGALACESLLRETRAR